MSDTAGTHQVPSTAVGEQEESGAPPPTALAAEGLQWLLSLMLCWEVEGGFASETTKGKPLEMCLLGIPERNLS